VLLREVRRVRELLEADAAELLDAAAAARLLGISEPSLYRLRSAGKCPAPVKLSAGLVRWRRSELLDYIRGLRAK
jgi:predicted DNA-binding transcriptional regulator AlpA